MQEHVEEHHLRSESKQSPVVKVKQFISTHQTASIIALFLALPILVISVVAAFINLSTRSAEQTASLTPTPTLVQNVDEGDDTIEVKDSPTPTVSTKLTVSPTSKVTGTPKPTVSAAKTSTPTPTSGPTSAPNKANLYFHSIVCNYAEGASGSATVKRLDDVTFASSDVPSTATCDVIFQNSEDVETGEIRYIVMSDSDEHKRADVGKLKKGNYPSGEFKRYEEIITLKKSTGNHELKFEINPEQNGSRLFPENSFSDNTRTVKYKVQ